MNNCVGIIGPTLPGPDERREPMVSVVIPAHNAAAFVSEAIQSVLDQTYPDYEIVVVNDGSNDDTAEIVSSYGPPVRCFSQPRGGASSARNRGIAEARGQLVAFLDADDLWLPRKLEEQVAAFQANPALGLTSTCAEYHAGHQVTLDEHRKRRILFGTPNIARAIVIHSGVNTSTVMVPRAVLEELGGFDEDLRIGEDDNLWIRITSRYPAALVDKVLVITRAREGSLSKDMERLYRDVMQSLDRLLARDPLARTKISDAVPIRKSQICCDYGYHQFRQGNHSQARAPLIEALEQNPRYARAWKYLALTFAPPKFVQILRRFRAEHGSVTSENRPRSMPYDGSSGRR